MLTIKIIIAIGEHSKHLLMPIFHFYMHFIKHFSMENINVCWVKILYQVMKGHRDVPGLEELMI